MERIFVNPNYLCNNHCRFCPHGNKRDELPPLDLEQTRALLEQAKQKGDRLVITGGEPSIRPDFIELLAMAKQMHFKEVLVETNGRMFSYKPFAAKAARQQITGYVVSVQGHVPELHDFLTRTEGSFKQTTQGIRNLKILRQQVYTNTVITRSNYRHLNAIMSMLVKLKVDAAHFSFVRPEGWVNEDPVRLMPRYALLEPYLKETYKLARRAKIAFSVDGVPPCFLIGMHKYLRDGSDTSQVWIDQEGIEVRDQKWRASETKTKGPVCEVCEAKDRCEGAYSEYIDAYGWNEFEPIGGDGEQFRITALPPGGSFQHDKPVEK